ncbi:hypothetical protein PGT21_033911 [Puccinia graminis f. sp. tritici]|uniref:Uncharacterized protein n=1 Tax=Puccinia graminis f. sp. tritici TaxID=56615 RepID=A0A5B0QLY6_PUCGR|nr:hypothetical protein PGT21_033911 [Puccinia graminis f. sp. tritici]KAA1114179.1 hypothetical protein PGTUg99_027168 [Puccinia graminis f. sp. tritici]
MSRFVASRIPKLSNATKSAIHTPRTDSTPCLSHSIDVRILNGLTSTDGVPTDARRIDVDSLQPVSKTDVRKKESSRTSPAIITSRLSRKAGQPKDLLGPHICPTAR